VKRDFTVFFTADIHGRDRASARIFTIYKREREKAEKEGRTCLFFDSGDSADRSLDYCGLTKCRAYTHVLNAMTYDAQTVGNDIGLVYGLPPLLESLKRIEYPVLGANFRDGENPPIPGITERLIFTYGRVKIGVFGMTNRWNNAYERVMGLRFPEEVSCAAEQVRRLKEEGAQIVIFLSHMGIAEEIEILFETQEIDLIIGGHSHTSTPAGLLNNRGVLIHHCGQYGENLGRVDFSIDDETGQIISREARLYPVDETIEEAPEILLAIQSAREEADIIGKKHLGITPVDLDLDYWNQCALGNFAADALSRFTKTDLAIVAGGNLTAPIKRGEIKMRDLSRACFSTVNPCVSTMTGQAISVTLERGLDEDLNRYYHHGLRGAPIGIPQVSGISVTADLSRIKGKRIAQIEVNGEPLDKDKKYRVAHTIWKAINSWGTFRKRIIVWRKSERKFLWWMFLSAIWKVHLNLTGPKRIGGTSSERGVATLFLINQLCYPLQNFYRRRYEQFQVFQTFVYTHNIARHRNYVCM